MFSDYAVFYQIGKEFLWGHYSALSLYPLPMVFVFALLALFPPEVGLVALLTVSIMILVSLFQWRALWWIWYIPVLQTLALGQVDVIALALLRLNTFWSLALLALKPQLFILAIPALWNDRALLKKTALGVALLYGLPTLIYPQWIEQWLRNVLADDRIVSATNAVLTISPVVVFGVVAGLTLARRWHWVTAATSFNPAIRSYDYALLSGVTTWLIPVSWLAWLAEATFGQWWAMGMCGVVAGVKMTLTPSRQSRAFGLSLAASRPAATRTREGRGSD